MKISLKIFLGYFILVGLAAWFILVIFVDEVKPGVRQAMEDTLVDTANVLAELAAPDLKAGKIQSGNFAQALSQYQARANKANIWGIRKQSSDYRVYITNQQGIVVFDSAGLALNQDYSRWNDVYLTLRGQYGVRSSPMIAGNENNDTVMYIAAPVKDGKEIIGALTVAKANRTLLPFIERAQSKIIRWGALLFALSIVIGVLFTWRFTRAIHRLRDYAIAVSKGQKVSNPSSSNDELAELAHAMQVMRDELDGKQYVQDSIQHLTHELKSPISAIQGASELLSPSMPASDQTHFINQIQSQSQRLQTIVQNMLGLAALEHQQQLPSLGKVNLNGLIQTQITHLSEKAQLRNIHFVLDVELILEVTAEPFLLGQAIYNLLENALDFSASSRPIQIHIQPQEKQVAITIYNHGEAIPDYALDKIFNKFYSLPRTHTGQKSTGLGLNFVQEVVKLHKGSISVKNETNNTVCATLLLPI